MVQLSHPYVTTGKTIALTTRTHVGKVMALLFNMLSNFSSKEQTSFNFMATVTIHNDFGVICNFLTYNHASVATRYVGHIFHSIMEVLFFLILLLSIKRSRLKVLSRAILMAQLVKNPPAMRETWVQSLDWEDPLEKETATHSSILARRMPWTV